MTCQVNKFKVVEYLDPFPLSAEDQGFFAITCSDTVAVQGYAALRKNLAATPGLLEKGDALFEAERFGEAALFFAQQAALAGDGELAQQARYKEALCLLGSKRENDAVPLLKALSNAEGNRWPVLADCQLYLLLLDRKDAASQMEADVVIERLLSRELREDHLIMLLPEATRQRFLAYDLPQGNFDLFVVPTKGRLDLVKGMQRKMKLERLLEADFLARKSTEIALVRLYRLADMEVDAELLSREFLSGYQHTDVHGYVHFALSHLCGSLRRAGRANEALLELNRWISGDRSRPGAEDHWLWPERARIYIDLGNWSQAEKDVDRFLDLEFVKGNWALVDAWCLKGFLREQAGDAKGAHAAWKQGCAQYAPVDRSKGIHGGMTPFVSYCIMAGLTNELSDEECRRIQKELARVAGDGQGKQLLSLVMEFQSPTVYREMWRTPRGRAMARKWAFRQCSYAEFGLFPVYANAAETIHQLTLPGPLSPEHEQIIWDVIENVYQSYAEEKLSKEQIITIGLSLKLPWLWGGVDSKLEPRVRGPLAYVLGHRFLSRDAKQAEALFQSALQAAPAGSPLQRLTQGEIAKLKKRSP